MRTVREGPGSMDAAATTATAAASPGKSPLSEKLPVQRKVIEATAAAPSDASPIAAPVQRKLAESPSLLQLFGPPIQMRDSGGAGPQAGHPPPPPRNPAPATPPPYADKIQASFGAAHDVSTIQAHVGDHATAACRDMGASAFASGHRVAFAGTPDLHTAAHEAAHVVQQAQGVQLYGGVGAANDRYE